MINRIKVSIGSLTITSFVDLSLSQPYDNHHSLELNFRSEDVNNAFGRRTGSRINLKELTKEWVGEKISLTIMQGEADSKGQLKTKTEQQFVGIVSAIQLQLKDAVDSIVTISAMSPTFVFNSGLDTRSFKEKTLSDIVNEVVRPFTGIMSAKVNPEFKSPIDYIVQFQEDSYHFLQRLAETYGEWFYYDGHDVIFGKSGRKSTQQTKLEYGSNLLQMEYEIRLASANFRGSFFDYLSDEKLVAPSQNERVNVEDHAQAALDKSEKLYSYESQDISFQGFGDRDDLKSAVKGRKNESYNKLAVLKCTSTSLEVKIGSLVKIQDDILENGKLQRTDDYGSFLVTNIRHYVDSHGLYQNNFEAVTQDTDYPPVDYRVFQPKAESQPAKVKETNDPESMGRVKVQFYWQKDGETTPWIRVATLMGGDQGGVYFTPEKGEVVFVDFEFGNPDLPFVRGSMYHGNVKPGDKLFEANNNFKGIITRGGNHIIIDDTGQKEEIRIYNRDNKNELVLSLNGSPHISIKSKGKITLEAEEIEMKAKTISMKADQNWSVVGNSVQIEGKEVSIEGKSQTSVKGSQLVLKGEGQASLEAKMVLIN